MKRWLHVLALNVVETLGNATNVHSPKANRSFFCIKCYWDWLQSLERELLPRWKNLICVNSRQVHTWYAESSGHLFYIQKRILLQFFHNWLQIMDAMPLSL